MTYQLFMQQTCDVPICWSCQTLNMLTWLVVMLKGLHGHFISTEGLLSIWMFLFLSCVVTELIYAYKTHNNLSLIPLVVLTVHTSVYCFSC
jgi:hypothetical protein